MSASAAQGWAAKRRPAAAILVSPAVRMRPMTRLCGAAMICGMLPQRIWERSSSVGHIPHPVCPAFDGSVLADQTEQTVGVSTQGRQLGDAIDGFAAGLPGAFAGHRPLDLLELGSIQRVDQGVAGRQATYCNPTVPEIDGIRGGQGLSDHLAFIVSLPLGCCVFPLVAL
jgi:hypothetical protein